MSEPPRERTSGLDAVLDATSTLASGLGIDRSELRMAEHFIATVHPLVPECALAARTVQSTTLKQVAMASSRPLADLDRDRLTLREEEWGEGAVPSPRLELTSEYAPLFDGTVDGRAFPLMAAGRLVGLVNLEAERDLPAREVATVAAMGDLLAAAVRNRRLSRDARFLRKWLATIIDNANALIFVVDASRNVTLCNRAMAELLESHPDEVIDRDVLQWVSEEQHGVVTRRLEAALDGRSYAGLEIFLRRKGGDTVATIFNMARPADVVDAVVAIGQDVSAVKVLENQVLQAEKLASLGQLAAGVVHEINNPLTSITVYADHMIKKFRGQGFVEERSMLQKIVDGSNRILKFTRDLVDYGRPSGSQPDVVSLNEVVQQSVSFCEHVLDQAGAELTVALAQDLPPLYGVRDQLQQVIINLLTNACHALGPSGGSLKVSTRDQGGRMLTVEVADNGCGILAVDLPLIFEPFFTTKTPGEGTGLGLSIVKKIVDFHNGRILVQSEQGKGSTFCIHLPTGHAE